LSDPEQTDATNTNNRHNGIHRTKQGTSLPSSHLAEDSTTLPSDRDSGTRRQDEPDKHIDVALKHDVNRSNKDRVHPVKKLKASTLIKDVGTSFKKRPASDKVSHTHPVKRRDKQSVFPAASSDSSDLESEMTYPCSPEDSKEKEYVYDGLRDYRVKNGKREVRVHWPEQDTWEPASEFPKEEVDRVMMRRAHMNTMFGPTKGRTKEGRRFAGHKIPCGQV